MGRLHGRRRHALHPTVNPLGGLHRTRAVDEPPLQVARLDMDGTAPSSLLALPDGRFAVGTEDSRVLVFEPPTLPMVGGTPAGSCVARAATG